MLNLYADKVLKEEIKNELSIEEIEAINKIDLKAGYYWLLKWSSFFIAAIMFILCMVFDSREILAVVIGLVALTLIFNWREDHWMDAQDKYLTDLSIVISLELKIKKESFGE